MIADWFFIKNFANFYYQNLQLDFAVEVAHYNFVRIHPFYDGNGRGARILMNLFFIKNNIRRPSVKPSNGASI